jgi:hypothetical protein
MVQPDSGPGDTAGRTRTIAARPDAGLQNLLLSVLSRADTADDEAEADREDRPENQFTPEPTAPVNMPELSALADPDGVAAGDVSVFPAHWSPEAAVDATWQLVEPPVNDADRIADLVEFPAEHAVQVPVQVEQALPVAFDPEPVEPIAWQAPSAPSSGLSLPTRVPAATPIAAPVLPPAVQPVLAPPSELTDLDSKHRPTDFVAERWEVEPEFAPIQGEAGTRHDDVGLPTVTASELTLLAQAMDDLRVRPGEEGLPPAVIFFQIIGPMLSNRVLEGFRDLIKGGVRGGDVVVSVNDRTIAMVCGGLFYPGDLEMIADRIRDRVNAKAPVIIQEAFAILIGGALSHADESQPSVIGRAERSRRQAEATRTGRVLIDYGMGPGVLPDL